MGSPTNEGPANEHEQSQVQNYRDFVDYVLRCTTAQNVGQRDPTLIWGFTNRV